MERSVERLGVDTSGVGPQTVEIWVQRITHQKIGWRTPVVVVRIAVNRRPVLVRLVPALIGDETEMLAEEETTQRAGEAGGRVWATVHVRLAGSGIFDNDSDFGIVVSELGTVIQVG
jgi:hypothetical protein